ncbi:MAG TPA: hypothetical protein VK932_19895, partial [Kofleriaceae bacterium]|nr:hypothetical protein [Kofleriaceae bacterium]
MSWPAAPGAARARDALRARLGDHAAGALTMAELFAEPLDRYTELISSVSGELTGFMTRGEDRRFTAQTAAALEYLGMTRDARDHHAALAGWMEHRRGFTKLEWAREGEAGRVVPLAAIYFRRRPAVADTLARLADRGVGSAGRELAAEVAGVLGKRTVHFVAAAFRPGSPVHHKLYFSQLVAADTHAEVARRVEAIVRRFGGTPAQVAIWQHHHAATVHRDDSTIFVSVSMTADQPSPSFKIDYPEVEPARAAAWA